MRQTFPPEFKDQACQLVMHQGYSISKASKELGISFNALSYWLKKRGFRISQDKTAQAAATSDDPKVLKTRIQELEAKLRRAEMEKDILKKAAAYFANHPS